MEEINDNNIKKQIREEREKTSKYINKTKINEEIINTFYKFYQRKIRKFDFISFLISGIVLLIVAGFGLSKGDKYSLGIMWNIIINMTLIVISIAFLVLSFKKPRYNKRVMEKIYDEDISEIENEYFFNNDSVIIINKFGETERIYEYLDAIYEDKKCYYIFINKKNSHIIRKDGFSKGKENEFNIFIKEKMGKNYKSRHKRKSG